MLARNRKSRAVQQNLGRDLSITLKDMLFCRDLELRSSGGGEFDVGRLKKNLDTANAENERF